MPARVRTGAESRVMFAPSSSTSPAVAVSWPEIRLKYVVLPAPFGPTIAVSSPGRNAQDTPLTATWPPKRIVNSRVSRERGMGGTSFPATRCSTKCCFAEPGPSRKPAPGTAPALQRTASRSATRCAASGARVLPLVPDRHGHVLDLELAHRLEHRPGDIRIDLDLEG